MSGFLEPPRGDKQEYTDLVALLSIEQKKVKQLTKERDELITQIGVAYYNNEELKVENDTVKAQINCLGAKNDDKGQLTVFHAWFEMPKDEYARLYKQINGDDSTMASCEV